MSIFVNGQPPALDHPRVAQRPMPVRFGAVSFVDPSQ